MQPVVAAAPMDLRGRLTRLRQDPALPPEASIVIPVDAARDLENVLRIVGDISHYAGGHSLEVLLVVNNYHPGQVPAIVAAYRRLGLRVVCVPDVRRPGEPPGFTGRFLGLRHLASDIGILFDADCRVPDATALLDWYIAQFAAGADVAYTHVGFHSYRAIPSIRAQIVTHHTARWVKREVLRRPTTRGSNYAVRRDVALQRYDEGYLADEMNVGPTIKALGGKVGYSGARDLIVLTSGRMFVGGWRHLARYLIYRLGYNARVLPVRRGVARYTRIGADSRPATVDAVGADQEQGPSLAPPGSDGMNRGERAPAAGALGSLAGKERRTLA